MAENFSHSQEIESGAIDVLYFPPAHHGPSGGEERCHESIAPVVDLMHQSGVSRVFVTQCKRWSCDRRWMCEYTQLDDVLRYTFPYPQEFIGVGGYHPLEIGNSLHQAEIGVKQHGFRGVFVHPASFGIALKDRRMYPLFAKALDWKVPVIVDVKHLNDEIAAVTVAEVEQIAADFSDVKLVIARADWSRAEYERVVEDYPNVYFCFDAASLASLRIRDFVASPLGRNRCMWGSNGLPWKQSLADIASLGISEVDSFLACNAVRVFGLEHLSPKRAKNYVPRPEHLARIVAE